MRPFRCAAIVIEYRERPVSQFKSREQTLN